MSMKSRMYQTLLMTMAMAMDDGYPYAIHRTSPEPLSHTSTREEKIRWLLDQPIEVRKEINNSPNTRVDGESIDTFVLRMALKKVVRHTL